MAWVKIPPEKHFWVCESGCYNNEFNLNEEHCNHSSDAHQDDGRHNVAHWQRRDNENDPPHSFLCNYHYEEYVLGIKHPQDEPVEPPKEVEWPSAAEFELFMGEVK